MIALRRERVAVIALHGRAAVIALRRGRAAIYQYEEVAENHVEMLVNLA